MNLDTVVLSGEDLALVDNVFASKKPKYKKKVVLSFTDGKLADARWVGGKAEDWGLTKPSLVNVDDSAQTCAAEVLIDLSLILSKSGTPPWWIRGKQAVSASVSPSTFRANVVLTAVHELVHVDQGWQIGKKFARDMFEEKISATNRFKDLSEKNPDIPEDPYHQNVFEAGARDFTTRWRDRNLESVHAGEFNFLLPMTTMRRIFPGGPEAFR